MEDKLRQVNWRELSVPCRRLCEDEKRHVEIISPYPNSGNDNSLIMFRRELSRALLRSTSRGEGGLELQDDFWWEIFKVKLRPIFFQEVLTHIQLGGESKIT